jgi:hypothetical protein
LVINARCWASGVIEPISKVGTLEKIIQVTSCHLIHGKASATPRRENFQQQQKHVEHDNMKK